MKNYVIILLVVLTLSFTTIKEDTNNKCGYNLKEANSVIVEKEDRCYRYEKETPKRSLMIVAHPDDETIFGGAHLLTDDYLVVCVTCGTVDYRVTEFETVMSRTGDDYIMLGHTDRENKTGPISNWANEYDTIYAELENIIESEDFKKIVTHNPDGEYGHIHHRMLSEMVTNITGKENLLYFGRWSYNGTGEQRIADNLYNIKLNDLLSVYYASQGTALNYNAGMFPYENFVTATEW